MFTITWHIENFGMCLRKKSDFISSPKFKIMKDDVEVRKLRLYPKIKSKDGNKVKCVLIPDIDFQANIKLSIISEHLSKTKVHEFNTNEKEKSIIKFEELREEIFKEENFFLANDVLILELKVKYLDKSTFCTRQVVKTTSDIECHTIELTKNMFKKSTHLKWLITEDVYVYLTNIKTQMKSLDSAEFKIIFEANENTMVINVKSMKTINSTIGSRCKMFFRKKEIKLEDPEFLFLEDNFKSYDAAFDFKEQEIYWAEFDILTAKFYYLDTAVKHTIHIFEMKDSIINYDLPYSTKAEPIDFQYFESIYRNNQFSDVIIKIAGNEFAAHKCVLSTSPFFNFIFQNNVSKEEKAIIEFDDSDLPVNIIDKMLFFMYTRTIKNLEFDDAIQLYSAAHNYQIPGLINKCSIFILENLSVQNFCKVLELLDMHKNHEMKEIVHNFILVNHKEIFRSSTWTILMEKKPRLTSDLMFDHYKNLHSSNPMDEYVSFKIEVAEAKLKIQKVIKNLQKEVKSNPTEIFRNIYVNKTFSDVTVKVGSIEFPIHKCVVGTSVGFATMFEKKLGGKEIKVVNICDVDEYTMDKILLFMYTRTIENSDVDSVIKIYAAAHKFQILKCKQECSAFILSNLTTQNVCEILELANLYEDQEMDKIVRNFIHENSKNVFSSENWGHFIAKNPTLAANIMRYEYMK